MKKYLPLYEKWMTDGQLPQFGGLCISFEYEGLDYHELENNFLTDTDEVGGWYASGYDNDDRWGEFTPLRQTIILFMAAMNGEL